MGWHGVVWDGMECSRPTTDSPRNTRGSVRRESDRVWNSPREIALAAVYGGPGAAVDAPHYTKYLKCLPESDHDSPGCVDPAVPGRSLGLYAI